MIRLTNTTLCIAASGPKEKGFWKRGSSLHLAPCLRVKNQVWYVFDKYYLSVRQFFPIKKFNFYICDVTLHFAFAGTKRTNQNSF